MTSLLIRSIENGVLRLVLDHNESRNSLSEAMMAELQAALDAAALDRDVKAIVIAALGPAFSSGHNLGTTKMGDDRETSVVDRWGRTHDVPNLYVIDGSVFTTSTATNPTATICALAKRTATFIANNRDQVVAW